MNYKKQVIIEVPDEEDTHQQRKQTHKSNQSKQERQDPEQDVPVVLKCKEHNLEITLFCCISSWHCEPLCIECIPNHTQQHNKNKTQPQIKKYADVLQLCKQKCCEFTDRLVTMKSQIQNLIDSPYSDDNSRNIRMWSESIIKLVQNYFTTVIEEYDRRTQALKEEQDNKLQKLLKYIEQISEEYSNRIDDVTLFNFNPEKELNQIQEDLEASQVKSQEEYKLNTILQKYLIDNIGRMILIEQKQQPQVQVQMPVKQIIKQKSTKCPTCGTQMEYLSDFKKHLQCPSCAKVKRPNTLKK